MIKGRQHFWRQTHQTNKKKVLNHSFCFFQRKVEEVWGVRYGSTKVRKWAKEWSAYPPITAHKTPRPKGLHKTRQNKIRGIALLWLSMIGNCHTSTSPSHPLTPALYSVIQNYDISIGSYWEKEEEGRNNSSSSCSRQRIPFTLIICHLMEGILPIICPLAHSPSNLEMDGLIFFFTLFDSVGKEEKEIFQRQQTLMGWERLGWTDAGMVCWLTR